MTRLDDFAINFSGLTHDHTVLNPPHDDHEHEDSCSTIAILRRHPMYDCLVLVKKYRACLQGHTLEFPLDKCSHHSEPACREEHSADAENINNRDPRTSGASSGTNSETAQPETTTKSCGRQRLISRFLDGDDPIYQSCCNNGLDLSQDLESSGGGGLVPPFAPQVDDNGQQCELVYVPINGLLDRLKGYTQSGVSVDSRVYAFAMGLKTAERILTTSSEKEVQETPLI